MTTPATTATGGEPAPRGQYRPSMRTAFVSLRLVNFRYLWYSQIASFTGMQMQQVARGLLAYQLTGSYAAVGVVMMAWGIPQTLFSLVGGAVADRVNRRNIILIVQFGTGGLSLLTAFLILIGVISIPILFVMGLFQGTLFAFNMPARQAYLAELVPQSELMNAIALNNMAMNATRIVGPALAGIVIAVWDISAAYFLQSFLYLFVIYFMFRLPPSTGHLRGNARRSVVAEIGEGLSYVRNSPTLRLLIMMAFIPTILGMPYMTLLPGFAVDELGQGAGSYGFMFTVTGVGAIVGSLAIASLTGYPRKPLLQIGAGLGWGASLLGLGLLARQFGYPGALVALCALGLFSTTYQTLNNTMVMAATDEAYYGRVMSIYMLTFSVFPLVAGPMGVVADHLSATTTFVLLGAGILVFVVGVFTLNSRYALSDERALAPEGAAGADAAG
ncbi:MAG: MFS transporter [Chloroflexi bacterium]|nr:MFS transporter [Chloroflexota bacterium]